jgi:tRNA 2-thiouridine synthesizing protein A
MTTEIDARGLSCPQPVVLVKKAMEEGQPKILEVLVDTVTSRENVSRTARASGYQVEMVERPGEFLLILRKG